MNYAERAIFLIDQSESHDVINHHPYVREISKELEMRASGFVDTLNTVEFWGEDWRVHLERNEIQVNEIRKIDSYESFKEMSEL